LGIICAIGKDPGEAFTALKEEKSGIGKLNRISSIYQGILPIAEVPFSNEALASLLGLDDIRGLNRTTLLGLVAARQAVVGTDFSTGKTGMLSATTVGGMERSEGFYEKFLEDQKKGLLRDIFTHDCADSTDRIAEDLGIHDFSGTISTACSSSVNTIMFGAELIRSGRLDRVVAGGTDSLTKFTINGFNTLMILDKNPCRPFDESRNGLTLGEGAAFVLLESEEMLQKTGRKPICEVSGYANANDAYHQTASSPEGTGAFLAMKKAIEKAGIDLSDISYINAHGTATINNDLSEGIAVKRLFEDRIPPFSSTKPFTGHTLGAAGAVEAVFSCMAITHGCIFPNLNFSNPIPEIGLIPAIQFMDGLNVRHVLSNSFGFGGNNSSVVFSKV